jgi:2-(1,2-epoxy-1,2-dihydrophenyl)acetyl-CoA isomerase
VVLTGAGRGFCAGASILADPGDARRRLACRAARRAGVGGRWVQRVVACEKPVVARVNGPAAGAGFGLALACDVRLVSAAATMTAGLRAPRAEPRRRE